VEHAASLRLIPNLDVWRPADTAETAVAWTMAHGQRHAAQRAAAVAPEPALCAQADLAAGRHRKGAYVLAEPAEVGLKKKAQAVIIATGSECSWRCTRRPSWPS
jgi:transketolase